MDDAGFSALAARELEAHVADDGPGALVAIYRDGALAASSSRGLASLEHGIAISASTVFDIASCSKQMTATLALLLAGEGVVDLEADVRDLVPELQVPGISLRHCLHHTSGLNDYMTVNELAGGRLADLATVQDFTKALARMVTVAFAPGDDIRYSNTGYVLTALALSRAAGRPFSDLMADRVFRPLGMTGTRLHDQVGVVVQNLAFSYEPREGGGYLRHEMIEEQVGDGAVLTSAVDLAGWQGFLLDGRGLGPEIRTQLLQGARLNDGRVGGYASGVLHRTINGVESISHGGGMYGYRSSILCLPSLGLGLSVLSNRGDFAASRLVRVLARALVDGTRDSDIADSAPVSTDGSCDPSGVWVADDGSDCIELTVTGTRLTVSPRGSVLEASAQGWQDSDEDARIQWVGDGLRFTDEMGRVVSFVRKRPSQDVDPSRLVGRYVAPDLDVAVVIEASADRANPGVCVKVGDGLSGKVTFAARHHGRTIFWVPDGVLLADAAHGSDLRLCVWGTAVSLERTG